MKNRSNATNRLITHSRTDNRHCESSEAIYLPTRLLRSAACNTGKLLPRNDVRIIYRGARSILFLFLMLISCSLFADENENIISKANGEYAKGSYFDAIESYQKVIKNGYESSDLYFNLGNAYFKVNNFSSALLYYEKARKLDPGNENIQFNSKITGTKIPDKIEEVQPVFFIKWFLDLRDVFGADTWAMLTIIFFALFFILSGFYLLSRSLTLRKFAFYAGLLFFVVTVLSFSLAASQYRHVTSKTEAIITNPSVSVKSSPSESSTDLFVIHEGTKVKIVDEVGDWCEIKIANGSRGWMKTSSFEKI